MFYQHQQLISSELSFPREKKKKERIIEKEKSLKFAKYYLRKKKKRKKSKNKLWIKIKVKKKEIFEFCMMNLQDEMTNRKKFFL